MLNEDSSTRSWNAIGDSWVAEPTANELSKSDRFRKLTRIPYFLFMRWDKLPHKSKTAISYAGD